MSFGETLALEGIAASIGSIGDAYDNALAESTIGLFKNEAIRDGSPFRSGPLRTIDDVEWVTAGWVDWYNARRLHSTLGDVPPDEYEAVYYADLETPARPVLEPALERQRTGDGSLLTWCGGRWKMCAGVSGDTRWGFGHVSLGCSASP